MSLEKLRIEVQTFFSQFSYCFLILNCRTLNNKINRLHERPLELFILIINHHLKAFLKKKALFQSLIEIFKAIEIYKFLHCFSSAIMDNIVKLNRPPTHYLRNRHELYNKHPKTVRYGAETISLLAQKMWAIIS